MGQIIFETDADSIVILTVDLNGKVNVMNDEFMEYMAQAIERLESSRDMLKGIIITSAKSTFLAGGDLALMARTRPGMEEQTFHHFEKLKSYLRRLELLGVPTVAAINGTALGGGYELCLACHHRIAVNRADALIGLPEVDFRILPAAGGVIRLTHLLGLKRALPWLVSGKKVSLQESLAEGLVDALVTDQSDLVDAAKNWIKRNPHPVQPFDSADRLTGMDKLSASDQDALKLAPAWLSELADQENYVAQRITDIAMQCLYLPWDAVSRIETQGFVELLMRAEAQKRIADFFEQRQGSR